MQDEYKPMSDFSLCGVYEIKSLTTGKIYLGSSKSIHLRVANHFDNLIKNCHANILLQTDFDKYGMNDFVWRIVEICEPENRIVREYELIEIAGRDNIYNLYLDMKPYEFVPFEYRFRYPPSNNGIGSPTWHEMQTWIPEQAELGNYISRTTLCDRFGVLKTTVAARNWLTIIYQSFKYEDGTPMFEFEVDPEIKPSRGRRVMRLKPVKR